MQVIVLRAVVGGGWYLIWLASPQGRARLFTPPFRAVIRYTKTGEGAARMHLAAVVAVNDYNQPQGQFAMLVSHTQLDRLCILLELSRGLQSLSIDRTNN